MDRGNYHSYAFWLKFDGAVRYFFAVAIGAVIARRSVVIAAALVAIAVWMWGIYVLYKVAAAVGPVDPSDLLIENLDGLVMTSLAGVLGAMLGRWFYGREIADVNAAA